MKVTSPYQINCKIPSHLSSLSIVLSWDASNLILSSMSITKHNRHAHLFVSYMSLTISELAQVAI